VQRCQLQAVPARVNGGTTVTDAGVGCFVPSEPESDVILGGALGASWRCHCRWRLWSGRPC